MPESDAPCPIMMSTARFLDHIKEGYDAGIRYCFILGSGVSVTSGIPMGRTLIEEWRSYLLKRGGSYIRECAADIGMDYAEIEPLFRPDYKVNSSDYFTFYDLRFAGKPVQAYWYLQNLMSKAEPSFGYYALAVLLEYTKNKLVITTNFDSLVEETLSLYHANRPLVLGHESLAMFMDSTENTGRSMIAKVHRDLLLQPKNSESELQKLAEAWTGPLRNAFSKYTPIIVGYAGGDKTLMSFMEGQKIGTVFWCTLGKTESDEDERIVRFLRNQEHGYLVNIRGFDEIMYELLDALLNGGNYDPPSKRIRDYASQRAESYVRQLNSIVDSYATISPKEDEDFMGAAKNALVDASGNDMDELFSGNISVDTSSESSLETLEGLLASEAEANQKRDKIVDLARLAWVRGSQALREDRLEDALWQYTEAVRLDSGNAAYHSSRGVALHEMCRYDEALVEKDAAVRLNPGNAEYHRSRGATLHEMYRYDEALSEIDEALRIEPANARFHRTRSVVLANMGRFDESLEEMDEAVRLEPEKALYHMNRGVVLGKMGRFDESLEEMDEAVRLEPRNAERHRSRGITLRKMGRLEESLDEIDRAIEMAPDVAISHGSRALTLREMGREGEAQAEEEIERRLSQD